jgi:hypothetical protein
MTNKQKLTIIMETDDENILDIEYYLKQVGKIIKFDTLGIKEIKE